MVIVCLVLNLVVIGFGLVLLFMGQKLTNNIPIMLGLGLVFHLIFMGQMYIINAWAMGQVILVMIGLWVRLYQ